ncbi:hypothetical protein C1645_830367 [Glomus cerebriforme]|uniref:Ion transport domain-containing protein n=1 Tax=Glomus cerebriforme TaxID=658196 RepID=A0A397SP56_9GLOM|nr:hypothetical protein C1645_830367 [Glomus cerebriforme]
MTTKYYVALSQDGHEVALFNSSKLEISTCTIDTLNEPEQFIYKPFQEVSSRLINTTWSLSISNKLANGEILIALSCFNKNNHLMQKDSKQHLETLKRQSINSVLLGTNNSNESLSELESGKAMKGFNYTWIFSTLNKERIRTTIDGLGGITKFLDTSSSYKQTIIVIHHYGITKANIPLNYRKYQSPFHYDSLRKRILTLYDKNLNNTTEFYFPSSVSNQIDNEVNNPQLSLFYKNIKKNYLFIQDFKMDKSNLLECYNLGGCNCGELINSFTINSDKHNIPDSYFRKTFKIDMIVEISKNEKLLAYHNRYFKNIITLYLMESSLEICTKKFTSIQSIHHIQFICNDEKLLIIGEQETRENHEVEIDLSKTIIKKRSIKTEQVFIVWDLFSSNSEEDSVKITRDSLNLLDIFQHYHSYANSNGNVIYINPEDGTVNSLFDHPDLINVLKTPSKNSLNPIDVVMVQEISGNIQIHPVFHFDRMLDINTLEKEVMVSIEPWIHSNTTQMLVFLNEDKTLRVIIGAYSIQVWRNKPSRKQPFLEYIWSRNHQKIEIKSLSVGRNEFLIEFTLVRSEKMRSLKFMENEEIIQIHWPHVLILKDACVALEYYIHADEHISSIFFDGIRTQIQRIVKSFIRDYPIIFQLTDIRYDIMGNLIRGNCVSIIKKILYKLSKSSEANLKAMNTRTDNNLHFPRLYSWDSNFPKKNDLEVAIESITGVHRKDTLIVGYLLDYYSDNAVKNSGWMVTVSQSLPYLYDHHLDYYIRELLYKPCFGKEQSYVDQSLVSSYELEKGYHKDAHAMYVHQGLQKKPNIMISKFTDKFVDASKKLKQSFLNIGKNDPSVITKLNIVPLPNFFVYPKYLPKEDGISLNKYYIWRILKIFFWPHGYIKLEDEQYSPFLRVLVRDNRTTIFSNPSFAALIDYKWRKAQLHFLRDMLVYFIFALSFSFITSIFPDDKNITNPRKKISFPFQITLYYLGYFKLSVEYLQLKHKDTSEETLRIYTIATSLITLVMWIELLLLLRFISGPANYINISLNIIHRVFYFFMFMFIVIVAIAHSMYLLLRSPDSIDLKPDGQNFAIFNSSTSENLAPDIAINQTFDVNDVSDNYFSNFWQSIVAVYFWINGRWDQLDQWNFLPVEILCFVASILLVTIMQNMLIAFMTSVFDDASASGRQAVLKFRADLICGYETLVKIVINRENENENPRKIYYTAKVEAVENWEREAKKYRKMHKIILVDRFDSLTDDEKNDNSDDENEYGEIWERISREVKGKEREKYSGSSVDGMSSKFNSIVGYKTFENNDVERIEKKMKEIQDEMRSKMKGLEDKLLELLKKP